METLLKDMIIYVIGSLIHNSPYLLLGILIAAVMKVYINPEKLKQVLLKRSNYSITGSVAFGAFTPLCACGTMAVIIAMLTTALPLGPIMAFLTSSPLMSPDGFVFIAGIIGIKFAIALTLASIIIGYGSGYITHFLETRTNFLKNQTRIPEKQKCGCDEKETGQEQVQTCGCGSSEPVQVKIQAKTQNGYKRERQINIQIKKYGCCEPNFNGTQKVSKERVMQLCCALPENINYEQVMNYYRVNEFEIADKLFNKFTGYAKKIKWNEIAKEVYEIGVKQILLYYTIFVAVGFLINSLVPGYIIVNLFSSKNIFAVPLAAIIGLPIYVNGESAIPLIKSLMAGGASGGAMLAFLITGPGTSAGVIAGISTILKKRALILYTLYLLAGGIVLGYLYDFLLAMGV